MRKELSSDTPELILIVTKDKKGRLEKSFQAGLDQLEEPYVALSLFVEKADLKNILKAIKLIDVKGLFITGDYQKMGRTFADVLEDGPLINAAVLKSKKYHGHYIPAASGDKNSWANQIASCIKLWTNENIDIDKLRRKLRN